MYTFADFSKREGLVDYTLDGAVQFRCAFALISKAGHEEKAQARKAGGGCARHLDAVHGWHAYVGQHEIEGPVRLLNFLQPVQPVFGGFHLMPRRSKGAGSERSDRKIVFNDKHFGHGTIVARKSYGSLNTSLFGVIPDHTHER